MEKIKELWNKFYSNKKLFWGVIGGAAALLVILAVVLAVCLGGGAMDGCTVTVKTAGGMAMEGVGVYVYTDADKKDMVSFAKTDAEGKAVIDGQVPAGSVAVLEDVPAGYKAAESYPVTAEDTEIILEIELLKEMAPITLGGVMFDFTVKDTDGTEHTLSKLLEKKNAVILNLWYTNCGPCKAEFPYLQEAYSGYSESVALLALNPVAEDNEDAVKAFKEENNLTFPMAKVDAAWADQVEGIAYPTTIVIDRFGTVALIHVGSIDDAKTFTDAFAYFTAENYVQSKVTNIKDLAVETAPSGEGTEANPLEFGGVTEFEVTVKPGEKVYCDVYKVSGMILKIEDAAATVTYDNIEYTPNDGIIELEVVSEDTFTPVKLAIGNTAAEEKTFKVMFSFLPGTNGNPYPMELGAVTAQIQAGNDQGVYYLYKATETGMLTVECVGATKDVKYDFTLYNLVSYKMLTYGENGFLKEGTNNPALSIPVNAGDEVQMIAATLPSEDNAYPAADLSFVASFEKGEAPSDDSSNSGGSAGGNTGGSTGGSSGGSTGGNSGGSTSGSTGATATEYEELYVGKAYFVKEGDNTVSLTSGQVNYFMYTPDRSGKYTVKVSTGTLSFWGNNTVGYIADQSRTESVVSRDSTSFTVNFTDGQLGSVILIGVEGSGNANLNIARTGAAVSKEVKWSTYSAKHAASAFTYAGGGLTMVDIAGPTVNVTLGDDGYYHWSNGSIVYVDLDDDTYLNSFKSWLESDRPVIQAGDKDTMTGWDFTVCIKQYVNSRDSSTGVYPMTEDLYFALQYLYKNLRWELNLMDCLGAGKTLNKDMGWMFCCCYEG